jgi:hypothetical protein
LVFATFVVCHTLLIIWPTCYRVNFLANFSQSLASNFLAIIYGCHNLPKLWVDKLWLGTKHAIVSKKPNMHDLCVFISKERLTMAKLAEKKIQR